MFWSAHRSWELRSEMKRIASISQECSSINFSRISRRRSYNPIPSLPLFSLENGWGSAKQTGEFPKGPVNAPGSHHVLFFLCNDDKPLFGFGLCTGMESCFALAPVFLFNPHSNYTRQISCWCPRLGSLQKENNCEISEMRSLCVFLSKSHNCQESIIALSKKCLTLLNN